MPATPQYGVDKNWVQSASAVQAPHVYDGAVHFGAAKVVQPLLLVVRHAPQEVPPSQ